MTARSIALFVAAAVAEIGGAYSMWQAIKEGRRPLFALTGAAALIGYDAVAAGRVVGILCPARCRRPGRVDPGDRLVVGAAIADGPLEQVLEAARECARVLRRAEQQGVRRADRRAQFGHGRIDRLALTVPGRD